MGHANISVTANIYTHRDAKVLHSNMAKLAPRGRRREVLGAGHAVSADAGTGAAGKEGEATP